MKYIDQAKREYERICSAIANQKMRDSTYLFKFSDLDHWRTVHRLRIHSDDSHLILMVKLFFLGVSEEEILNMKYKEKLTYIYLFGD